MSNQQDMKQMNLLVDALKPQSQMSILDVGANPLIEGEISYQGRLDIGHAKVP